MTSVHPHMHATDSMQTKHCSMGAAVLFQLDQAWLSACKPGRSVLTEMTSDQDLQSMRTKFSSAIRTLIVISRKPRPAETDDNYIVATRCISTYSAYRFPPLSVSHAPLMNIHTGASKRSKPECFKTIHNETVALIPALVQP